MNGGEQLALLVVVAIVLAVAFAFVVNSKGGYLRYEKINRALTYSRWLSVRYPTLTTKAAAAVRLEEIEAHRFELSDAEVREKLYIQWIYQGLHQQ